MDYSKEYKQLNIIHACFIYYIIVTCVDVFYPPELSSISVNNFIVSTATGGLSLAIILCAKQQYSRLLNIAGILSAIFFATILILRYIVKSDGGSLYIIFGLLYFSFLIMICLKWYLIDKNRYKEQYLKYLQ